MPTITLLFASLHVLLLIALLVPVSLHRRRRQIGIGDGGDPALLRKIRVHANFVEHVPLALLMLALLELAGLSPPLLWLLGAALLLARLMHATGLSRGAGYSLGRFWGTAITWGVLLAMAICGMWLSARILLAG